MPAIMRVPMGLPELFPIFGPSHLWLHRLIHQLQGVRATAQAVPRLEHLATDTVGTQNPCGRQAREARADDQHLRIVRVSSAHGQAVERPDLDARIARL